MHEILLTFLRSVFAFVLALASTRLLGRKAISQMTFIDFVVAISIGSVTSIIAISNMNSVYSSATALITLAVLAVLTDYFHMKSIKFAKLVQSEPVIMIANGRIIDQNLKKARISIQDLTALLRDKNIFNIADIEFAVIESDGKLSVLLKSQKQPVTPSDLNISTGYKGLTKDIIIDGRVMSENLKATYLNEEWLIDQLSKNGINNISDVFYAGLDTSGNLYVSKKGTDKEIHGKYGLE